MPKHINQKVCVAVLLEIENGFTLPNVCKQFDLCKLAHINNPYTLFVK